MANRVQNWMLLSVLSLAGCASARAPQPPDLPRSVSPGWRLTGIETLAASEFPDQVRSANPQAGWRATYSGPSTAHVRLWAFSAPVAFDLAQRWSAQPKTVVLHSDGYFAAVDWDRADRSEAGALVRAVEKALR